MSLALCMIVGSDPPEILERALESAAPFIDELCIALTGDKRTTRTLTSAARRWVKRIGAGQVARYQDPLNLGHLSDFGKARQFSFELATLPWRLWIDADDVLEGGEILADLVASLDLERWPLPQAGLNLPYFYGHDEYGNPTTILTRTRIVYWPFGWQWLRRVHEDIKPTQALEIVKTAEAIVRHLPPVEMGEHQAASSTRNLALLRLELEDDPDDSRTHLYLAHQHMALRQWEQALAWYRRYVEGRPPANLELWQAWHFLAICHRQIGRLADAAAAEMEAINLAPELADPYYGLAAIALETGDPDEALHWDRLGQNCHAPPAGVVFLNPMEYSYNRVLTASLAHKARGEIAEALAEIDGALQIRPGDEYLQHQRRELVAIGEKQERVRAWDLVAGLMDPRRALQALEDIGGPRAVLGFPGATERMVRAQHQLQLETTHRPRVAIYCGQSVEPFGPDSVQAGRGGSETAVIRVGEELARLGASVFVYNNPGPEVGKVQTVGDLGFYPWELYDPGADFDLWVAWRQPAMVGGRPANGCPAWLWMHDLHTADTFTENRIRQFDLVRPVSAWAANYLELLYPWLEAYRDRVAPTRNGTDLIGLQRADPDSGPLRVIYASSPDRGLEYLLQVWQDVALVVEDAELHLYYGWEVWDAIARATGNRWMMQKKQEILATMGRLPRITNHGRVSKAELAEAWQRAAVWAYPTDFMEVSCITAMDAMATGTAILTSHFAALPETLGDVGIQLEGPAGGVAYERRFTGYLINLLTCPENRARAAAGGLQRAASLGWDGVAREWMERIG